MYESTSKYITNNIFYRPTSNNVTKLTEEKGRSINGLKLWILRGHYLKQWSRSNDLWPILKSPSDKEIVLLNNF